MSYRYTYARPSFGFGRTWTPAVKALILANGGVFLVHHLLFGYSFQLFLGLDTSHPLQLWRYASYLFLHGSVMHLLFNMFALWIFGSDLEEYFGRERFLSYYFFTGIGAGVTVAVLDLVTGQRSLVIGASGAVFGLLLAYGVVYAERTITLLLFFVVPVTLRARSFVIIFAVVEFLFGIHPGASNVAHFAHLGGMAFGYLYLKRPLPGLSFRFPGAESWRSLKGRFQAYRSQWDERRMDELLQKVNRQGIQSLTEEEKAFLHRMSQQKKWH